MRTVQPLDERIDRLCTDVRRVGDRGNEMIKVSLTKRGIATKRGVSLLRSAAAKGMKKMLLDWSDATMPNHFKRGAGNKYKYQRRSTAYQRRKDRRGLGPMVYTGKSKQKILSQHPQVTGTSKKVIMRIKVTGPFGRRYKGWNHKMGDELTVMTKDETNKMFKVLQEDITTELNESKFTESMRF